MLHASILLARVPTLLACESHMPIAGADVGGHAGSSVKAECTSFARALSGVRLSGQATGRHLRLRTPEVGGILVLRRSVALPDGHAAVISRLVSTRHTLVTRANWVHHRVTVGQPG